MCGIAGAVDPGGSACDIVAGMRDALAHRGPDGEGLFIDREAGFALGHRRLAVIDTSAAGRQPMSTQDGRFVGVLNGEIYNFIELRSELEREGVAFISRSDTEVLLNAFVAWGSAVLDRLRGMFAFAVWDRQERSLFLARDRVGKKPLYYFWNGKTFAFASELKALKRLPSFEPRLEPDAVDLYLSLGYVPAPLSIFRHVHKLEAGHCLTYREKKVSVARYWKPESARPDGRIGAPPGETFKRLFRDAVALRLRADVPLGILLSGGIDSSMVAAEAVSLGASPHALTARFDHDDTDVPYARLVSKRLGLRHDVVTVDMGDVRSLDDIVAHYDEPFGDSSIVPTFMIARAMSSHCKVVLNGDGGDEAFAGYPHYLHAAWKQRAKALACLLGIRDGHWRSPWDVYFQSKVLFRRAQRRRLLSHVGHDGCALSRFISTNPFLSSEVEGGLRRALHGDRHVYLPNDILYKADMALSAFGLEGRSPFLDHRLLEWAQNLGGAELLRGGLLKTILIDAAADSLPREVLHRPKHGFGAPIGRWLQGELSKALRELLPCPLLEASEQRLPREPARQWNLLVFALWARHAEARW